jgi:hypothetical protein
MYDEHSYRKPPRQPAAAQAHWGETVAGKVTMERLGREENRIFQTNPKSMNIVRQSFIFVVYRVFTLYTNYKELSVIDFL